ncbi:hypothetical protein CNY89_30020, partial [Amaricoccus sp. HAR-UPW-R2A-40]
PIRQPPPFSPAAISATRSCTRNPPVSNRADHLHQRFRLQPIRQPPPFSPAAISATRSCTRNPPVSNRADHL